MPMPVISCYVRCDVLPGFFDSEYLVGFGEAPDKSSAFIDRCNVRVDTPPTSGNPTVGAVRAYIIEEEADRILIEVPGEPVVGGLRSWVPAEAVHS